MNSMQPVKIETASEDPILPPAKSVFTASIYKPTARITPDDITMVICLRAHEGNPWVLDRLRLIKEYYNPLPRVLIVDFGSTEEFAREVTDICEQAGFSYFHEPDTDTYSPAAAHNRGYEQCETDLLFFCDADCFGSRDMFKRLSDLATSLRMRDVIDTPLVLPVYHINEPDTAAFFELKTAEDKSSYIDAFTYYSGIAEFRKSENFFIAPYSNIFLINKKMFSLTGGYDERFRGHGSEDFEFLTRLSLYIKNLPEPVNVGTDWLGPLTKNFFKARPYSGFRRLLEALSKPAENFGLKVHHLYHPKPKAAAWEANNDWRRERLNGAFEGYLGKEHNFLSADFLAREMTCVCLCKHHDQWGYYTPLRLAGYKLNPVFDDGPEIIAEISEAILSGTVNALAIFNPYMKSHANFKQLVLLARERGIKVIVIERGALPNTIYYDDDVAYNSASFSEEAFLAEAFSVSELDRAADYAVELRSGDKTLESMDPYEVTAQKHAALMALNQTKYFVPLQLEDDMAVTMFVTGEQNYADFSASVESVIDANPDAIFIVKPHPLSKLDALRSKPNLVIAAREDNIHCLLDIASGTVCYNSGVGLLSIIHGKPTMTIGNAFYNMSGAGYRAKSLEEAVDAFNAGKVTAPDADLVKRVIAWFTFRRYSTFTAVDSIREFVARKSHGYRDILVTHFRWGGHDISLGRQKQISPYSIRSYIASQLADTLGSAFSSNGGKKVSAPFHYTVNPVSRWRAPLVPVARPIVGVLGNKQDLRKYDADPARFFSELSNPWYRMVGKALFPHKVKK